MLYGSSAVQSVQLSGDREVEGKAGGGGRIGVDLHFKYDEKLFHRYTRNAQVRLLTECLLVHYWLLAGMAWREQCSVGSQFGQTVSIQKTKHMFFLFYCMGLSAGFL